MKALARFAAAAIALVLVAAAGIWLLDRTPDIAPTAASPATAEQIARGAVLARAGNCMACHTPRGGAPYAGGRAIATPFGTVYSGNLTPDAATGLGRWSADDFWRALHHGRGIDGRRLIPAFPYTEFTKITRADSDALFAWLRTLPAVAQPKRPHELRGLYGSQLALAAWRVLFFRPGEWRDDPAQSAEWNRGAYLVHGVGHCVACHGGRNALGGQSAAGFGGGLIPAGHWVAPSLTRADEAGMADWPLDEIVALLRDGVAPHGRVSGPMAEVVLHGTQHLPAAELRAMAVFLKSLPQEGMARVATGTIDSVRSTRGERLYADHCAECHGRQGEGGVTAAGERAVPALAGNRLVTMDPPINLVRLIALGGFAPATAGHPRPFGMPPFAHALSDEQLADVASYLRSSWGAQAASVSAFDVSRWRGGIDD
jgi:mono/diheme cytochrome c family protein